MKKKIVGVAIIAVLVVAIGWNFNLSKNEVVLSNLAMANIEVLAKGERWSGHCWNTLWNDVCCDRGVNACIRDSAKFVLPQSLLK